MNSLFFGALGALIGCGGHALSLRFLSVAWRLKILPILVAIAFTFAALTCVIAGIAAPNGMDLAVGLLLALSLAFGYALVMSAVVADSPTMALSAYILSYAPDGMPSGELETFIRQHQFIETRLLALTAVGEIEKDGDHILLRGRSSAFLEIGRRYRQIRGDDVSQTG